MAESFVVSFFVDECSDEEMNTYIGSRFIPYIYELMQEHKNIVFLLPYGYASSESVARTVRVVAESHPYVKVQCRKVGKCSTESSHEKIVNMSDLAFFYFEESEGRVYDTMKYAEGTGKKYINMK